MATQVGHAMPERWTELMTARRRKRACTEQVEAIKKACSSDCGKRHVVECEKCFGLTVDRMRSRYRDSTDQEWFADRRAFVQELDGLFVDVKLRKRSLESVQTSIESEKEAWYRWMLRRHPDFLALAENGARKNDLRTMLDDPDLSRDVLVDSIWEGVGKASSWEQSLDEFTGKIAAADGNAQALKELYLSEFFMDKAENRPLDNAESYIATYQTDGGLSIEEIIDRIVRDSHQSRDYQPRRENHQKRLDELRRAKTAFELNKARAKSAAKSAQGPTAGQDLYDLPPCSVCDKAVDKSSVMSCAVCQALTQMGGDKALTLYCSETCLAEGQERHVELAHDCTAGDDCAQVDDEDVEMGEDSSEAVVCQQCHEGKAMTLFCSNKCAAKNFARHAKDKHGEKAATKPLDEALRRLTDAVNGTLEKENPKMMFSTV